jgi:hypothetical protein
VCQAFDGLPGAKLMVFAMVEHSANLTGNIKGND